jgi:two-component system, OmpR family, response regulator
MFQKSNPLIYIVDSSVTYRKIIVACLEALNFTEYKTFDDGESCYTTIGLIPDIIILDYNLGEGKWDGLEFMSEYIRLNKKTKFIFLSSNTKIDVAVESVRMGAIDYILKSKSGLMRLAKQVDIFRNSLATRRIEQKQLKVL